MNLSDEDREMLARIGGERAHGRGHRDTPERKARLLSAAHPASAALAFAPACSLRRYLGPILDQGQTSTCFGHATASLVYLALAAAGAPLPWFPSPLGIARNAYCEEQPLLASDTLQDVGADMGDVMSAIAREGIRAMGPLAPGRFSDVTPENIRLRPTLADDEASAREIVLGPEQLQPFAPDFLPQIATSIDVMRCGVSLGIHASPAFERWFESPPAGLTALTDRSGWTSTDGHDVACSDYRTEADGTLSFWLRSSWGPGGDEGGIWVAGAWLAGGGCVEAWRMRVVASVARPVAA